MNERPAPPKEKPDHRITLEQARALVKNHRRYAPPGSGRCGYFDRAIINEILSQKGCSGIRVYYGKSDEGKTSLVLVGVTDGGQDITDGVIADKHMDCPPHCDPDSALDNV
jgi:hypothetical protein